MTLQTPSTLAKGQSSNKKGEIEKVSVMGIWVEFCASVATTLISELQTNAERHAFAANCSHLTG
jgi:hypothetical protein